MRESLNKLVNNFYTDKQKEQTKEVINECKDEYLSNEENHFLNYKVLAIPFQDNMIKLSDDEIKEFYEVPYMALLNEVDFVVANLITTLAKLTDKDIKPEYENAFVLDKDQPEFEYLVNGVEEYLSKQ